MAGSAFERPVPAPARITSYRAASWRSGQPMDPPYFVANVGMNFPGATDCVAGPAPCENKATETRAAAVTRIFGVMRRRCEIMELTVNGIRLPALLIPGLEKRLPL